MRRSPALRRLEFVWRRIQPAWDRAVDATFAKRGYPAVINGDRLRVTYRYGARYEKIGYEPAVHQAFTETITRGMIVLDIGAHVGLFSLAASCRTGASGRVYAFEPSPETSVLLERHIRMNGFDDRIEVVRKAVGDRVGETSFYVRGATMSAAVFRENIERLSPETTGSPVAEVRVPATTIDAFCAERNIEPDRIKIDIEGGELAALRGAAAALAGAAAIVCEVHEEALEYLGGTVDEVEQLLSRYDRIVERIDDPNALGIYHLLSRADRPT
jgi:FkbM family methyltransferase